VRLEGDMGRLKPGASYVYEHADGITYAREVGAHPNERFEIGRSLGRQDLDQHNEWMRIRTAAKANPSLQKAVDRVILIYRTIKDHE
jgi:hypothetical protein